ncbi:hypothetical protein CMUS01_12202 [Colletotrichum musicola]|uniref:NACHT-NTPase and P-loop NTPases N-terminal domain-containing protein n=1 Tax=Colletotrichum musicola TaxID=2175873 RepID=A0A8H6N1E4_9PEZI|nr:hypothetical protein CMUS01_12202 [Colletotrichum musicola]
MAEVFETVASAAALAELCVKSIFKVKKLWDEVKGPFLQRIEAMINRQRHVTSEPTSQSIQAYGNVARRLESLAASLKQQMNCARKEKRTLKKLKSMLEKDLIQSYRVRPHHCLANVPFL